jgi:hypothetical protein
MQTSCGLERSPDALPTSGTVAARDGVESASRGATPRSLSAVGARNWAVAAAGAAFQDDRFAQYDQTAPFHAEWPGGRCARDPAGMTRLFSLIPLVVAGPLWALSAAGRQPLGIAFAGEVK